MAGLTPGGRLPPELLELIAERFKALAEPARLQILDILREGERTVADLAAQTGLGPANVSKHLRMLYLMGFVTRRKAGPNIYYRLADEGVFQLCAIVCERLRDAIRRQQEAVEGILPPQI